MCSWATWLPTLQVLRVKLLRIIFVPSEKVLHLIYEELRIILPRARKANFACIWLKEPSRGRAEAQTPTD